jgi:alginate O-acetyltransferase complex protein AlgI
MQYAVNYLKNMFGLIVEHDIAYEKCYYIDNIEIFVFFVAIICSMPIFSQMLYIKYEKKIVRGMINIWLILLFIVSTAYIAASTYNPFIYFRF